MKKIWLKAFCGGCAILAVAGCNNMGVYEYSANSGAMAVVTPVRGEKTVGVLPVVDRRSYGYTGSYSWGLLPLMPGGFYTTQMPEINGDLLDMRYYNFDPANDLAESECMSLNYSGLFKDAQLLNGKETNAVRPTDYVWRGELLEFSYRGGAFSYCISYFGAPVLWLIGFPMGGSTNTVGMKFTLLERESGHAVWEKEYHLDSYVNQWIYSNSEKAARMYPILVKTIMNTAVNDLAAANVVE